MATHAGRRLKNNMFENAKYGDNFLCRNNTIAIYHKYDDTALRHCLIVSDDENDFIMCKNDGHVYDKEYLDKVRPDGKTICEYHNWDREEKINFRLDVIKRIEDGKDLSKEQPAYTYEQMATLNFQLQGLINSKDEAFFKLREECEYYKNQLKLIKNIINN